MFKLPPYIEILDFPSRFLVDGESPDRGIIKFFNDREIYPHLVDLEEPPHGWCSCSDFQKNGEERKCIHIIYAQSFRNQLTKPPKSLPPNLFVNE